MRHRVDVLSDVRCKARQLLRRPILIAKFVSLELERPLLEGGGVRKRRIEVHEIVHRFVAGARTDLLLDMLMLERLGEPSAGDQKTGIAGWTAKIKFQAVEVKDTG